MSDCYFPWCGVDGRQCVDCARDARVAAAAPIAARDASAMTDDEWDQMIGAGAFIAGERFDWHESPAWQRGFGDAIGIRRAPDLDDLEADEVYL